MKKTFWITGLFLLWLFLVIRNTPAEFGLWLVDSPLQLDGISGTIWSGRAANAVLPFQDSSYTLGEIEWQLSPWSLLTFKPCINLSSEYQNQSLSGNACVGTGGDAEFSDVVVKLPAEMTKLWLPIVQVKGGLLFHIDSLEVKDNSIQKLLGKGRWDDAYFHNSFEWIDLGAIAFEFTESASGGVNSKVVDVEGPLSLDLLYEFSLEGTFSLKGDIVVKQDARPELGQMLKFVAQEKAPNHFYIEQAGN